MIKRYCDSCGGEIVGEPNKITLNARKGLDGAVWAEYELCDKCFKEIYKKVTLARRLDPNTTEGTLRQISLNQGKMQDEV